MKNKLAAIIFALLGATNAHGLSQCPPQVKDCGKNPFSALVVGFSQVCSERQPANAEYYEAAVAAYFNGHTKEFEELRLDPEFQRGLQEFRKIAATMPNAELDGECATLLSKGKDKKPPGEPVK